MSDHGQTLPDAMSVAWRDLAVSYAGGKGYTFTPDCLSDLTAFLNGGAFQLRSADAEASSSSHVDEVKRIVDYMITELGRTTPGQTELHEWTLTAAKSGLCPLFPFC
jgi:hypothetical protein